MRVDPGLAAYERVRTFGAWYFTATAALVVLRFVLKLLGAEGPAARLVFAATEPLIAPFLQLFGHPGGSVLEFPALFALAAWSFILWAVLEVARLLLSPEED